MSRQDLSRIDFNLFFASEAQRIVFQAAEVQAGDSIKAQMKRAGENLPGLTPTEVWRAWHGRTGSRGFAKVHAEGRRYARRRWKEI